MSRNPSVVRHNVGPRGAQPHPAGRIAILFLACLVPLTGSVLAGESPVLRIEQPEIELGQLIRGETGLATFVLHNAGNAPLRILEVEPGCRCTVVDFDAEIAPGARGELVASLETDELHGKQARWVKLRTNDPMNPETRLVLTGEVVGSVNLFPHDKARLSDRTPESSNATILIRKEEGETGELRLSDVRARDPWLKISAVRLEERVRIAPNLPMCSVGDWRLDLAIGPEAPYGWSATEVRVKTGLPRQPEIAIPVRLERVPPVDLSKGELVLPKRGPHEAEVLVSVRSSLDPAALGVETAASGVDLRLEPAGGRHYRLKVRWDGKRFPRAPIVFVHGEERLEVPFKKDGEV